MGFPAQLELQHRIRRACLDEDARPLVFVLGAGASLGSVPGTGEMVGFFERSIATDSEDLADFKSTVRTLPAAQQYQAGARFLIERAGLTHLNHVIRLAVLRARTPTIEPHLIRSYLADEGRLKDLEDDNAGWAVPQGISAIGRILSRVPGEVVGPILTTNFDPLLEVALRTCGMESFPIIADGDGSFTYPERPSGVVPVAHLHGYWRNGDTLHTAAQLTNPRPRLLGSLRQILTNSTCIVLGYGGWDDVLTSSLLQVVQEGSQRQLEVLWGCHGHEPNLGVLTGSQLPGRVQPYIQVDANSLLPAVDAALAERSRDRRVTTLKRRNRVALGGCTLVDADFRAVQLAREVSTESTVAFFDGREPNWIDIFGGRAPLLERSKALLDAILAWQFEKPGCLVEGPTGEGKSTTIRQVAAAICDLPEYQVWWANAGERIDVATMIGLSVTSVRNCLFVDDADLHISTLGPLLSQLTRTRRTDFRVFMAARDTDWLRSAQRALAPPPTAYQRIVMKGLTPSDALKIVEGWSKFGPRALGRLADVSASTQARANRLYSESLATLGR